MLLVGGSRVPGSGAGSHDFDLPLHGHECDFPQPGLGRPNETKWNGKQNSQPKEKPPEVPRVQRPAPGAVPGAGHFDWLFLLLHGIRRNDQRVLGRNRNDCAV